MASDSTEKAIDRYKSLEKSLKEFGFETGKKMKSRLAVLGLKDRARLARSQSKVRFDVRERKKDGVTTRKVTTRKEKFLYKSIGSRIKKKRGDLESMAFSFARHGIFIEHGVGKHRPVRSSAAEQAKQVWLGPILDQAAEDLADLLAEDFADIVAVELTIRVPGIIDTKVTGVNNREIFKEGDKQVRDIIDKSLF